jgi:predicted 3-demethylubiquinone-9 3-methyltransferase (glyoxalase superfamily)
MADNKSKKGQQDRSKVSGSENYEIQYFKDKMGISSQAVTDAIRATGSNDRKTLEAYLKKRHNK